MNYCRTLIFIYFASITLGTGYGSELGRKDDRKDKLPGKVDKGHKNLLKLQRCCEGDDVLLCVNIELDPSTITSKKDLQLEPLNATLVFKEKTGKKEFKYGNDEFDLTFDKQKSKGTFGFSNYKNDGRVLQIESCRKNGYVLKIATRENARNFLIGKEPDQKISEDNLRGSNCRHNGFSMTWKAIRVGDYYYRSDCQERCMNDKHCFAWTWEKSGWFSNGDCQQLKATLSSYAWWRASGPVIHQSECNIGPKKCSIYSGLVGIRFLEVSNRVYSASSCEAKCKLTDHCNRWNWYYNTCYMYTYYHPYHSKHYSAERC